MNVIIFGATGMIGQGVLRECPLDPEVGLVETVGRTATGIADPKLREIVHRETSAGMTEADYERITYGATMAAAETLARLNPRMTFVYVSGAGTDSSEKGRTECADVPALQHPL